MNIKKIDIDNIDK